MTLQTKIALTFTLICTVIVVALSSAVYYFSFEKTFHDFYTRLELRAIIAARASLDTNQINSGAFEQIRNEHLQRLPQETEYIFRLDTLRQFLNSPDAPPLPLDFIQSLLNKEDASFRDNYRFYKGIHYHSSSGNYAVIVGAVNTFAQGFLSNIKTILFIATLLSIVVIFTAGQFFSRQILAPIRRVTQEVNQISATSLNKRLPAKTGRDEITALTNTFNTMLGRLETSFETQNNFVSNASHELNTPLTAIIGEAEFALSKKRPVEAYEQGMQVILSQAEKLRNITRSLLELAQSGFNGTLSFEEIDVSDLVRNVRQVASNIYPDCNLVLDQSLYPSDHESVLIHGNFHLLELCISNIILNACKYANGQQVTVALASSSQHVIFIIKDRGIGIPEQDMPHIFDPFFRASNVQSAQGYGIGLPLANNIIKLHKGTIHVASKEFEGTEVVLKIPRLESHGNM